MPIAQCRGCWGIKLRFCRKNACLWQYLSFFGSRFYSCAFNFLCHNNHIRNLPVYLLFQIEALFSAGHRVCYIKVFDVAYFIKEKEWKKKLMTRRYLILRNL